MSIIYIFIESCHVKNSSIFTIAFRPYENIWDELIFTVNHTHITPCDKSLDNSASMPLDSCSEKRSSHWGHVCTGGESFMKSILHCDAISKGIFCDQTPFILIFSQIPRVFFAFFFPPRQIPNYFPRWESRATLVAQPMFRGAPVACVLVWTVHMDRNACHSQCF